MFPDYYYFNSSKSTENDTLKIKSDDYDFRQVMKFNRPLIDKNLYISMEIVNKNFETDMHFVITTGSSSTTGDDIYRDDYRELKFDNLPDILNFFNEKYETVAKVFNEMLMEKIKDELEEEKRSKRKNKSKTKKSLNKKKAKQSKEKDKKVESKVAKEKDKKEKESQKKWLRKKLKSY